MRNNWLKLCFYFSLRVHGPTRKLQTSPIWSRGCAESEILTCCENGRGGSGLMLLNAPKATRAIVNIVAPRRREGCFTTCRLCVVAFSFTLPALLCASFAI